MSFLAKSLSSEKRLTDAAWIKKIPFGSLAISTTFGGTFCFGVSVVAAGFGAGGGVLGAAGCAGGGAGGVVWLGGGV